MVATISLHAATKADTTPGSDDLPGECLKNPWAAPGQGRYVGPSTLWFREPLQRVTPSGAPIATHLVTDGWASFMNFVEYAPRSQVVLLAGLGHMSVVEEQENI